MRSTRKAAILAFLKPAVVADANGARKVPKIQTPRDVRAFFRALSNYVAWHPEDSFRSYVSNRTGKRTFTNKEADALQALLDHCQEVVQEDWIQFGGLHALANDCQPWRFRSRHDYDCNGNTNGRRADRAAAAVEAYMQAGGYGAGMCSPREVISDLICDLHHYCDRERHPSGVANGESMYTHNAEMNDCYESGKSCYEQER